MEIKLSGRRVRFNPGDRVYDLLSPTEQKKYILCRLSRGVKELGYRLSARDDGRSVYLLGVKNKEACKAYEATLRFLLLVAFHRLYPGVRVQFSYHVSRAVYCEALTPDFNMFDAVPALRAEMERLVAANLPIERVSMTREEAENFFRAAGRDDQLELLAMRPENRLHLYRCDGYTDDLHTLMAPGTGCLSSYRLMPFSPGLILQYPRYELSGGMPDFTEENTYARSLYEATRFAGRTGLSGVPGINRAARTNPTDFVLMCEARHTDQLAQLGEQIAGGGKNAANIRLVAIAGPSSSGKTTFCHRLRVELLSRGMTPVMISLDNYYREKEEICRIQGRDEAHLDLEDLCCLDTERFNRDMFALIAGDPVTLPYFNFQTRRREEGSTVRADAQSPIMIEGIHALNERLTESISRHQKYKIYIAPQAQLNLDCHTPLSTTDLRLLRRLIRDMKFRNSPAENTLTMWQSVRAGEFKWIYPTQEGADFVFNSFLWYELCVIRKQALPALMAVPQGHPQRLAAERLCEYLSYFVPLEDESAIPGSSILREFLGGSCFR